GHCGKAEHAKLLRKMLDDPARRLTNGVDGILAAYVLLEPKEGWQYLTGLIKDPSKEFTTRYAALRAVRFFWDLRPDVVGRKEMVEGIRPLLDQGDIADLAIEDLRKWGRWECATEILALRGKKSHDIPIIRRAILRYALSCPENAEAVAFVDGQRKKDPR